VADLAFAATPTQEALWWVHQRAKHKSVYHITWRMGCASRLDFAALQAAWQAVVDRHEALRTSVELRDGAPTLTAQPQVTAQARLIEVADPGSVPVTTLLRLIAEEVHDEPIPLDQAPLGRLTLVRVGEEDELLFTVHHLAVDGWAMQLLLADLSAAYLELADGAEPFFGADPVPFHEFASDLHAARENGRWRQTIDHWRTALAGAVGVTVAPDRPRHAGTGADGTTLRYAFSQEAADGAIALAKASTTTSFAVVLAAVQIVLARGGAGPEVALGVLAANRLGARDQGMVGYLANLCVARAHVDDTDTVADVIGRARDTMWQVLAHQAVPYPVVFDALPEATQASLGDTPPVLLTYLGPIGGDLRLGEVPLTLHRNPNRAARSDLTVGYWDGPDGIHAEVEYSVDRYDQQTVLRLLHDVDAVLTAAGGDAVGSLAVRTKSTPGQAPLPGQVHEEPPESSAMRQISRAWADVLGHPPTGPDQDFFADGGRSLKVVQLATAIESDTGVRLDLVTWLADPTPRRIADQLTGGDTTGEVPSTLVTLREGDDVHLHLVHGAGGAAHDYRELLDTLPEGWRVTLSQERTAADSVPAMAAAYRFDLEAAGLRPDVLGGWSLGGMIAFELAAGYADPVPPVVLIDSPPPIGYQVDDDIVRERVDAFVATVCLSLDVDLDSALPVVSPGNVDLTMRALAACLSAAGQPVPAAALVERWNTYHRHSLAVAGYVSDRTLPTAGIVVGADLTDDEVQQWAGKLAPSTQVLRVAADHFAVLRPPAVAEIGALIARLALPTKV
jgi:thioesterase domain-containing protein